MLSATSNGGGTKKEMYGGIVVDPETKTQYEYVISQTYMLNGEQPVIPVIDT